VQPVQLVVKVLLFLGAVAAYPYLRALVLANAIKGKVGFGLAPVLVLKHYTLIKIK